MERKLVFVTPKEGTLIDIHIANKPISQDIGDGYDKKRSLIIDFLHPLYLAHRLVDSNHTDLTQALDKYLSYLEEKTTKSFMLIDPYADVFEMNVEVNKFVLNILTSISLFLIQVDKLIKNQFGKKSEEYRNFELLRKGLHKNSLSYRFCYDLRNYSQHYSIPINKLAINFNLNEPPSITATIVKSKLTDGNYKWKSYGLAALNELEESFDLIPHITNYVDIMNQLFSFLFTTCESVLIEFNVVVRNILDNGGCHHNNRFFFGCDIKENELKMDTEEIPYTFVKKLEQYVLKLDRYKTENQQ
ncbi:hypothetical protein [Colwellia sp. MB02u-14]|uniref:hypothetical protein n=1 Tax=Colwellia sp. MB02u-14 TaxID=2759815 RepID=UPI0015F497D4|nr:hypothetical protein [Colwellia sp. MB02u-14]MBA6303192.1 hypothetical protein [Colwellia sp. MB02u-14]